MLQGSQSGVCRFFISAGWRGAEICSGALCEHTQDGFTQDKRFGRSACGRQGVDYGGQERSSLVCKWQSNHVRWEQ